MGKADGALKKLWGWEGQPGGTGKGQSRRFEGPWAHLQSSLLLGRY